MPEHTGSPQDRITAEELRAIITAEVGAYLGGDDQIGVSALAAVGDVRAELVCGLADRKNGTYVRADTVFLIGSCQKTFTNTLAAGRVIRGEMSLGSQITDFLADEVRKEGSVIRQVTPVSLATMTAAMPHANVPGRPAYSLYRGEPAPAQIIEFWKKFNPTWRIGAKTLYANVSEVTLGFAAVHAAKARYEDLFDAEIRRPLGMSDTVLDVDKLPKDRVAIGYNTKGNRIKFRGVGWNSTAADMMSFLQAELFRPVVMPPLLVRAMELTQEPHFTISAQKSIGMAWYITAVSGGAQVIAKDGSNAGFAAWIGFVPQKAAAIVLLSNGQLAKKTTGLGEVGTKILLTATHLSRLGPSPSAEDDPDQGAGAAGMDDG